MVEPSNIEEYVKKEDFDPSTSSGQVRKEGDWKDKLKNFIESKYFVLVVIILLSIIAYSLGRISGLENKRPEVKIISENLGEVKGVSSAEQAPSTTNSSEVVVGSKNSNKYHYPWCAGAKQISPQNLITFNSIGGARAAGYTPASNCKGLK
ncbi:MAG: hypothetical protein A3E02_00130 [Candidatus Zambryskibacteria bacterium RIFCSPHIGHO2_12_FULL_38_34]|uniref:Ada DNA repair metal-binding domain-containing protein n=1 Tax=Candidatus Zambryskibacteria bacterium RIFCSPLOWO2_12_FULL_39_16 TaxID=1802775 RepID=A0A1G2URP2_9BACT|nr:MAG: hypothetical protein A3E02_00130 [Candidatus Zambryskibacteria bacterium RIFCSPHIGHO2_12_FULL_38_34]OHB09279.1 MAG: hypothetical protein A3I19_03160 [Candidatus Zambryskibacteria bacterium RIFCSPLOWO2_02_FULL_38_13]OHB12029.1 MAG: hypothetical protein A3G46_00830 [Candidatus Zambryskibacteria bacterium RIFCSPLOWO2_12_FULL_39_16]